MTKTARVEGPSIAGAPSRVLAVAYFMTIVDLTIVNVALPTIGRKLHFSRPNLQWSSPLRAHFGGFLLLGGRAADLLDADARHARLGVFTATSLACALATTGRRSDPRCVGCRTRRRDPWCPRRSRS